VKRKGTVILCYHRVAQGVPDPFHLCVQPENFAAHLEEIARTREPSTLSNLSEPSRRPRVVVTFDDGYSDNLSNVLPIVTAKGFPITVFVTTGMVGGDKGFWWDRLGALLRARPEGTTEIALVLAGDEVRIPLGAGGEKALEDIRRHLISLPVSEIDRALEAVAEQWSVRSLSPPDARVLTPDELRQLAATELVTIGAHTVDHVRLRGRRGEEQLETVATSKKELEQLLNKKISHFAYPFGRAEDFDDDSVDAVRLAGFETACTTLPGSVGPSTDRYRLPRRLVMDWGRTRFRAQLQRWKLG
jgi:peptidoglycan/xylan/chitin deacetylase (PgdA/CDA1 family)